MTDGRSLARRQLDELAAVSSGAVELLTAEEDNDGTTAFSISLDTRGAARSDAGVRVRDRERFIIQVGPGYPFSPPSVQVSHRRWAGTPHVQWGDQLCLYAAPSVEWSPADGMNGFIDRLVTWVERAAAGTLDPDGEPLHPPAVYTVGDAGTVIVKADIAGRAPWSDGHQWQDPSDERAAVVGWCTVEDDRVRVMEWLEWIDVYDRVLADDFVPFSDGRPLVVVPALLCDTQLGFEYPLQASDLLLALDAAGVNQEKILSVLGSAIIVNRVLRASQLAADRPAAGSPVGPSITDDDRAPLLTALLLGTPARRVAVERLTHLAAWNFGPVGELLAGAHADFRRDPDSVRLLGRVGEIAAEWLDSAVIRWMPVMEDRPEITRRRDADTPATWLAGKNVLLLGAGALGGPVAEHCVRAGVASLHIVDHGKVTPGILVRQPYSDADIGRYKARTLADRLTTLTPDAAVTCAVRSVRTVLTSERFDVLGYDLIVDATADAGARSVLEAERGRRDVSWPPLLTMLIGHDATRGLVTISTGGSDGAGDDALRQTALNAFDDPGRWADIADDFFPAEPRTEMFFPEPGCSAPTFVGGAPQTAALAGQLLYEALLALASSDLSAPVRVAGVRIGAAASDRGTTRARFPHGITAVDDMFGYRIRLHPTALAEMKAEVRRGLRLRGPSVETGGMLLGAIDDAVGVIHVDRVTGPPPDSYLSSCYFEHGRVGTQAAIDTRLQTSRGITGFVGYWHTHPQGSAAPSPTDEAGMASIVTPDGRRHRALMVIVGDPQDTWTHWLADDTARPAIFARLVPRTQTSAEGSAMTTPQTAPPGTYFRGGYSPPVPTTLGDTPSAHTPFTAALRDRWARIRGNRP